MTQEEIQLRTKFYLAPKSTTIEELKTMNDKFTSYPGLTMEQAKETYNKILEFKINENIKILNYVTDKEVFALYKISKALIMPTYFGPTNIPPVEAWSLDVPVAYSSYLSDHGRNAALYFHPDSSDELVEVLLKLQIGPIRKKLILNGRKRLKEICNNNIIGHNLLIDKIKNVGAESKRFLEELN